MRSTATKRPRPAGAQTYTRTAIALHWLIAALIATGFALGLIVADMSFSPQKLRYVAYHKWIGVTVFLLAAARLVWRLTHRPPPLLPTATWQAAVAKFAHALLYVLMLLVPVLGWLFSSASGVPVVYLGWWRLPDLVPRDKSLAIALLQLHQAYAWLLCYVVALHVAAVLKHHFMDRDATLRRMWRWRRAGDA